MKVEAVQFMPAPRSARAGHTGATKFAVQQRHYRVANLTLS